MRYITMLVLLAILPVNVICAQNLTQRLLHVQDLMEDDKEDEALSLLRSMEKNYIGSDNDTLKVVFNEFMGYLLMKKNENALSIPYMERVILLSEKINIKDAGYLEAFLGLGMAYQRLGKCDLSETYYRKGLLNCVVNPDGQIYMSHFFLNLGHLYKQQGDTLLAKECYNRIDKKRFGSLVDAESDSLVNLDELKAIELRKNGEYEKSLAVYDKLLNRTKEIIGTNNEDYARLLYSKGIVLSLNLLRYDEAKPLFKEVIDLGDYLGNDDENLRWSYGRYLQILSREGKIEEIAEFLPEALKLARLHDEEGLLMRLMGYGAYSAERYADAIPYYEKYIALSPNEEGLSYLEIPNMLSVCYIKTDEYKKALELLSSVMDKYSTELDEHLKIKSSIFHNYGRSIMLDGRYKEAIPYFEEANEIFQKLYGETNSKTTKYLEICRRHL